MIKSRIPTVVLSLILGSLIGHMAATRGYTGAATVSSIIRENTDTINKLGSLNEILHDNSDTMMRFAHYLNPHTTHTQLCPECSGRHHEPSRTVYGEPVDDGVGGIDDLRSDARELNNAVGRTLSHVACQHDTLTRALAKMRGAGK